MKFRILISTLIVALAALGSVAAFADTTQPTQIVTGKVISSTPTQLVVQDDKGARTTFVVENGMVPSTIMVGDRVSVNYQSQAGGSFRATNVAATSLSNTTTSDATGVNTNDSSTNDAMLSQRTGTGAGSSYNQTTGTGSSYDQTTSGSTYESNTGSTTGSMNSADTSSNYARNTTSSTDSTLPATASNNPLILLLGLLALGGFALRLVVRS